MQDEEKGANYEDCSERNEKYWNSVFSWAVVHCVPADGDQCGRIGKDKEDGHWKWGCILNIIILSNRWLFMKLPALMNKRNRSLYCNVMLFVSAAVDSFSGIGLSCGGSIKWDYYLFENVHIVQWLLRLQRL